MRHLALSTRRLLTICAIWGDPEPKGALDRNGDNPGALNHA